MMSAPNMGRTYRAPARPALKNSLPKEEGVKTLSAFEVKMETTLKLGGRVLEKRGTFTAALVAGQLGGLAFVALWLFAYAVSFRGLPWTWPIRVIASFLLGESALHAPTALTYVLGILLNQAVAFAWSAAFGWVAVSTVYSPRLATNVVGGLILGLLAAFVDTVFLVPPLFWILQDMNPWWGALSRSWDWLAHIAFGMSTGWFFEVFRPRLR